MRESTRTSTIVKPTPGKPVVSKAWSLNSSVLASSAATGTTGQRILTTVAPTAVRPNTRKLDPDAAATTRGTAKPVRQVRTQTASSSLKLPTRSDKSMALGERQ